jgi:hypothetical protein
MIPRGAIIAMGAIALFAFVAAGAVRLSGVDVREPDAAAVETRSLRFEDLPDGSIAVIDPRSGARIDYLKHRPSRSCGGRIAQPRIACGDGAVDLLRVQRAGKAAQSAEEMLRGFPLPPGTVLSPSSSEPPRGER